jgi:hypothetical protein
MPRPRFARWWVLTAAAVTAAAVAAGTPAASALQASPAVAAGRVQPGRHASDGLGPAAAHPHLTTDTNARCNKPEPAGYARCFAIVRTPPDHVITADSSGPPATALTPADIQSAYSLPSATAGKGETVAVVDAGNDPDAASDLATFRSQYGLSACTTASGCFAQVNQEGQSSPLPSDLGWGLEISLDLDAVSSACPNCHILLVEAAEASIGDLGAAVDEAVKLGAVAVSNSYGSANAAGVGIEFPGETADDKYYDHPGVAVTASAGDGGYAVNYPSASPYVTAVGGTTLTKDTSTSRGWAETVWGDGTEGAKGDGTGSGCSKYEAQPSWQAGITRDCTQRATADVSADASPQSGLAVYDTDGEGGWLQVGGTSLASPLIAASFALAGTPAAGSYPSSYLYAHYLAKPSVFHNITSGSNGTCGNVLCTAGPGWNGPTGLGTPDGVSGFTYLQTGSITGTVTAAATGQPVAGAAVSIPRMRVATGSNGTYTLNGLPAGGYKVTVSGYGYQTQTQTVTVTAGQASTQNVQLAGTPHETVSGTVTAATGTGWPLYAKVSWSDGDGHSGTAYTTPATGKYSLSLLATSSYRLTVTPLYPGYTAPAATTVTVGTGNVTQNLALGVDTLTCAAVGYHPVLSNGTTQAFTGTSAPKGWTVHNINLGYPGYAYTPGWVFDNPGKRANKTGGTGNFAIVDSAHDGVHNYQDTYLTSPALNFTADKSPAVQFATDLAGASNSTAAVGLSVNGGKTWTSVWHNTGAAGDPGPATVVIPLPTAAGKKDARVRFGYTGEDSGWWEVDNVFLGNRTCTQQAGALLTGRATGSSGSAVNGAVVASVTTPAEKATTVATPGDTSIDGGLYDLFATGTGSQKFTASASGYTSSTQTATLTAGQVTTLSFTLTAASSSSGRGG